MLNLLNKVSFVNQRFLWILCRLLLSKNLDKLMILEPNVCKACSKIYQGLATSCQDLARSTKILQRFCMIPGRSWKAFLRSCQDVARFCQNFCMIFQDHGKIMNDIPTALQDLGKIIPRFCHTIKSWQDHGKNLAGSCKIMTWSWQESCRIL